MTKFFFTSITICFIFIPFSCTTEVAQETNNTLPKEVEKIETGTKIAQSIISSAIKTAGLDGLEDGKAAFDFREKHYTYQRNGGIYKYERRFNDDGKRIVDVLTNEGFTRWMNNDSLNLEAKKANAYANSVNSVIYFAFLPLRLNDPAVNPKYLGKVNIQGKAYNKIQVTFSEEAGGDDFDDVFIYWFDTETYQMDYLAYEYHTDGGGMRFREAVNPRKVNGVVIQDYKNYKPKEKGNVPLDQTDRAFQNDELVLLSEIVLENVKIEFD